jgi:hypothetical protein
MIVGMIALFLGAVSAAETPRSVTTTLTVAPDKCLIYGTAVDINAVPVPDAPVRLRNLETKTVVQSGMTNQVGEFRFIAEPGFPYVVEIADRPGRVLAVGDVVVPRAGEMAGGTVVLPAPVSTAIQGLLRGSAGAVASAVAGVGLTILPTSPPLSPEK